ncbi:hypothetical protein [Lacipirellula sp.]|uniref:hypothetical protein n=1 Tax=Lacipirellula sp. TaxID=2691419 RepID=UPI003D0ADE29
MKSTSVRSGLTWAEQRTGAELLRVGEGSSRAFIILSTADSTTLRALADSAIEAADWLDESQSMDAEMRLEMAR